MTPPNIAGAIEGNNQIKQGAWHQVFVGPNLTPYVLYFVKISTDAKLATELAPAERKGWCVLANAQEASGNVQGAIDALREWGIVDVSFSVKSKKEIERLSCLL